MNDNNNSSYSKASEDATIQIRCFRGYVFLENRKCACKILKKRPPGKSELFLQILCNIFSWCSFPCKMWPVLTQCCKTFFQGVFYPSKRIENCSYNIFSRRSLRKSFPIFDHPWITWAILFTYFFLKCPENCVGDLKHYLKKSLIEKKVWQRLAHRLPLHIYLTLVRTSRDSADKSDEL